jgi:hypothetical protein
MSFPDLHEIPAALFAIDGNCGPISAWMALRYFRKRVAASRLVKLCRHTKKYGTFTISIAVALKQCGLSPVFHTEEDSEKKRIEISSYKAASQLGIPIRPALSLEELRELVLSGAFVIVFFDTIGGNGHLSPVASIGEQKISFHYSNEASLLLETFQARWSAPEICRQAIVIHG